MQVPLIQPIGAAVISFVVYLGQIGTLAWHALESLLHGKFRWKLWWEQMLEIGVRSQPIVFITGGFTGAVLSAQAILQFQKVSMASASGALVAVAMFRELGPVMTGLMLSGRIGAAMAAEIGTMKVTEQIDALRTMNVHPMDYLVMPRIMAVMGAIPILVLEAIVCGIVASHIIGVFVFNVGEPYWGFWLKNFVSLSDLVISLIKSLVFGFLIVIISCHQGLETSNGAVGVGRATTRAMVYSSLAILMANFFLTMLLSLFVPISKQ